MTACPLPAPFATVTVVPLGTKSVEADWIETIVPVPLFISGLLEGKYVSCKIGTNPPTSSIKSITRKSIAPVVAIFASLPDHVSPLEIVSVESCLKYLASDSVSVKYLLSNWPPSNSVSV